MKKYTKELFREYKLVLPDTLTKEWLRSKALKERYTCCMCKRQLVVYEVYTVRELTNRPLCKKCAISCTVTEDICPEVIR